MTQSSIKVILRALAEDPLEAIEEHIDIEPMAPPSPSTLAPDEVLISIRSASVGWVDLLMTSSLYQHKPTPPYIPGMEFAGVVLAAGEGAAGQVSEGQRVMVDAFQVGPRTSGDYRHVGGFASFAVVPLSALVPMPSRFSFAQGSHFFGSYETAYHCLVACGKLQAGETVLIHGASGATGLAALHVAKRLGAQVIATGRSPEKLEVVKAQGADHVLAIKDTATGGTRRFRDDVKALTGGKGADVVYDGVGGDVSLESLRCVQFGARFLIVGWASTPFVAKGKQGQANPNMLPTNLIMMKGLQVLGCPTIITTQKHPSIRKERLETLLQWAEEGSLSPFISHTFPLSHIHEAMRTKWSGVTIGGCTVEMQAP